MPVERVIALQQTDRNLVLYGPAFSDAAPYFKLRSVVERHPDVIVLGTSRVMQFRSGFFKEDVRFYDAGGGVSKIRHFARFLEQIPVSQQPKLIIIGLDQYFYNANWDNLSEDNIDYLLSAESSPNILDVVKASWSEVYKAYFKGKYQLAGLASSRGDATLIGLNAIANSNGFRNDGSYYYGKYISDPDNPSNEDYGFRDTLSRIANGNGRFEYGDSISDGAIEETASFLETCKARGIYVVGFLPPFAHEIYQKLESMPQQYNYMRQLAPTLNPIFQNEGFAFFDFSDLASVGASDEEAIDGFHAGEKANLRLFIQMVEANSILMQYAEDVSTLKQKIDLSTSNYTVFGD